MSANQRVLRKLVQREIGGNVSELINHFLQNPECFQGSDYAYDDVLDLSRTVNYELTFESWWADLDEEEKREKLEEYNVESDEEILQDQALLEEIIEEENLDLEYDEVLEHWIVSDWLADELAERGEAVAEDFFGLTIWGRTTSGQAILLDSVIEEIGRDMGILEGQENHKYWLD